MKGKKLAALLIYLALAGTQGQVNSTELSFPGATNPEGYRLMNITDADVDRLLQCICLRELAALCTLPVTTPIDGVADSISTIEPLSHCQININERINCIRENVSNDTLCAIQCYNFSDDRVSVNVTNDNGQKVEFSLQNSAAEIQTACQGFFASTFTSPVPRLEDRTTTSFSRSSETVNNTVYYESNGLSSGAIAGIVVGVTLGFAALVCIIVGYLLCRRRYLRVEKKVPRPPAKSYLHNESFKKIGNSCEHGNIGSLSAKDVEKNSSTTGVYNNQAFKPDNTSAVVDTSDSGDGLVYEDISGIRSMNENPGYLQRISSAAKNKYNTSETNSTYSNVPENYLARDSCLARDLGQDYVELSSENSDKLPVPNNFKFNQTVPSKPNLSLYVNNTDPIVISTVNVFDESLSPNDDNKKESVYFELERASDDEGDNTESENDTEIYSNI